MKTTTQETATWTTNGIVFTTAESADWYTRTTLERAASGGIVVVRHNGGRWEIYRTDRAGLEHFAGYVTDRAVPSATRAAAARLVLAFNAERARVLRAAVAG